MALGIGVSCSVDLVSETGYARRSMLLLIGTICSSYLTEDCNDVKLVCRPLLRLKATPHFIKMPYVIMTLSLLAFRLILSHLNK